FDEADLKEADKFISRIDLKKGEYLIGIHAGAAKVPNRWSALKYAYLIKKINENYPAKFYLTGSSADKEIIRYVELNVPFKVFPVVNRMIPEVAALISRS